MKLIAVVSVLVLAIGASNAKSLRASKFNISNFIFTWLNQSASSYCDYKCYSCHHRRWIACRVQIFARRRCQRSCCHFGPSGPDHCWKHARFGSKPVRLFLYRFSITNYLLMNFFILIFMTFLFCVSFQIDCQWSSRRLFQANIRRCPGSAEQLPEERHHRRYVHSRTVGRRSGFHRCRNDD